MLKAILRTALTLVILAFFLPTVTFMNWTTLLFASVVLALLMKVARPILKILFLPINIVTLGLFSWVINVFLLWLVTFLVPGFDIEPMIFLGIHLSPFMSLLLVSFFISIIQSFVSILL